MVAGVLSRRRLLALSGAAVGALALPTVAQADAALVDPYIGAIPFVFPLADGAYDLPLQNNWHGLREGRLYPWNHRGSTALRAHDGVDVYPSSTDSLPQVYAPLQGIVAAVCTRSDNTLQATVTYRASSKTPPPWDYHDAADNVAKLPLYGNFVWLLSTDPASAGYYVFFCHLQNDATLRSLAPDQAVSVQTPLAVMGDTGNAAGYPQLHVEVHYPRGQTYTCGECSPQKTLTAINPYASLLLATKRPAATAAASVISPQHAVTASLAGRSGGAFATYSLANPGPEALTATLTYTPFDAGQAHAIGLNVYQNNAMIGTATGQATGLGDPLNSSTIRLRVTPGPGTASLAIQVFNYSNQTVHYTISA